MNSLKSKIQKAWWANMVLWIISVVFTIFYFIPFLYLVNLVFSWIFGLGFFIAMIVLGVFLNKAKNSSVPQRIKSAAKTSSVIFFVLSGIQVFTLILGSIPLIGLAAAVINFIAFIIWIVAMVKARYTYKEMSERSE
ncbi:hypothetical protein GE118_01165 [Mycoplasma sp. NEAQ87857]|uniref:hypothetical protein n=1 Tax=Mycoplasma sp. NEAQ87857 TaxID=2683967 RepID=UPI0013169040|nr:hypothetical protein [Mycoplasma sp. NEAQ87857]QGZ97403.1 hypothetical protein GE118_01165 [Mycoplasma sp. NEAQ87857]